MHEIDFRLHLNVQTAISKFGLCQGKFQKFRPSKYSPLPIIRLGPSMIFEENLHWVTVIWTGPKLDLEQNSHQVPNLKRVARSFPELTSSVPFLDGVLFSLY